MNQNDLSEAVRATAMLADVTISVWSAERTDAAIMEKVKFDAGAVGNVGRCVKNMLAGADGLLKDAKSAYAAVRQTHYGVTLPWIADPHAERIRGPRLLPTLLWDTYMTRMGAAKRAAQDARDKFIHEYPALVERAKNNLGTLATDIYPPADDVSKAFRIAVDLTPIHSSQEFRGLPAHTLEKLGASLAAKQARMIQSAETAMWAEVRERVGHLATRLQDPKATFQTTTVESVKELIPLVTGWNLTQDHRAAEIVDDIEEMLQGVRPEDLRKDALVRTTVAQQAQAVTEKLLQWGL